MSEVLPRQRRHRPRPTTVVAWALWTVSVILVAILSALRAEVLATVAQTVEPTSVSLWLCE